MAYFTPKGRPVWSEMVAGLVRKTHLNLKKIQDKMPIQLELTLTSISPVIESTSGEQGISESINAIGNGLLSDPDLGNIFFQWSVKCPKWELIKEDDLEKSYDSSGKKIWEETSVTIEYKPSNEIPNWLNDRVREILWHSADSLAYMYGGYTIQSPFSIMQQFFMINYLYDPVVEIPEDIVDRLETPERFNELYLDWIFSRQAEEGIEDTANALREFISAINSYWQVGTRNHLRIYR